MPLTNSRSSVLDDWYKGSTKEIQSEPFLIKQRARSTNKKKENTNHTTVANSLIYSLLRPRSRMSEPKCICSPHPHLEKRQLKTRLFKILVFIPLVCKMDQIFLLSIQIHNKIYTNTLTFRSLHPSAVLV